MITEKKTVKNGKGTEFSFSSGKGKQGDEITVRFIPDLETDAHILTYLVFESKDTKVVYSGFLEKEEG